MFVIQLILRVMTAVITMIIWDDDDDDDDNENGDT